MVARRPDGLYDIPELGLSGVPESYVPVEHRQPVAIGAPMLTGLPDQRLAMGDDNTANAWTSENRPQFLGASREQLLPPSKSDVVPQMSFAPEATSQYDAIAENAQREAVKQNAVSSVINKFSTPEPAPSPQMSRVNPGELHGPAGGEQAPGEGNPYVDAAWNEAIRRGERGTPGQLVRGGMQKAAEAYVNRSEGPGPGLAALRDYTAADINRQAAREQMASEGARYNRQLAEGIDPQALGYDDYSQREAQYQRGIQEQQAQRQAITDQYIGERAGILDKIKNQAQKSRMDGYWAERGTGAAVGSAIAAALLSMGDAVIPHSQKGTTFLQSIADDAATRQRDTLNALGQDYSNNVNALAEIQRNFLSPEAADSAYKASVYRQMQNEAAAWGKRFEGMGYQNKANEIQAALQQLEAEETQNALKYEHTTAYQLVPDRIVGGASGGIPGGIAAIKAQLRGAPKETVDAAINKYMADVKAGHNAEFPGAAPGKQDARGAHYAAASKVHLDPMFTGGVGGTAYTADDPKLANQIANTQAQAKASIEILDDLDTLASKVGHSFTPTDRAKVINAAEALKGKVLAMAGEGMTEEKFASIERRLNLKAYESVTNVADLKKLTQQNRKDIQTTARALIPTFNLTRTPRGTDYVNASNSGKTGTVPASSGGDDSEGGVEFE